ncbi:hypothetical protein LTR84_003212 [Exophiala bonariae]|uniref:L-ornithine N(5)-monooxygenase n=1 Tax=Exophiala bonariae TaxID=1690606 RepID=A0AAV9NBS4_9EURO|nr:hypothetical protein LTR84_003212 [Exophiala bonariae]
MPSPSTIGVVTPGSTYDLVCIGFGASALSLAIALKERQSLASTVFLEQQPQARWKPCHSLISPRMKTSFLSDLVTSENPRSKFTFVSYLHSTNQLVTYTNSGRIAPSRPMFADYLRWCAKQFESHVCFGNRVVGVMPRNGNNGLLEGWNVLYEDISTGQRGSITSRQVVCAAGLQQKIPNVLSAQSIRPRVAHSSEALEAISEVLKDKRQTPKIAIVGETSHAAEIFVHLHGIHGNHNVHWLTQRSEVKGKEETPFALESLHQSHQVPPEFSRQGGERSRSANALPRQLMTEIYDFMYDQSVKQPDSSKCRFQVRHSTSITNCQVTPDNKVELGFQSGATLNLGSKSDIYDLVISATGYDTSEHRRILSPLSQLVDGHNITVAADYQVNFRSGVKKSNTGVWLLHSPIDSDEIDDALYQILAQRSARVAQALIEQRKLPAEETTSEDRSARL